MLRTNSPPARWETPGYTYWTARHALVRYVDRQGRVHTVETAPDLPVGRLVPLAYNPVHPDRAAEPTMTRELRGAAVGLVAALGLVLGMLLA